MCNIKNKLINIKHNCNSDCISCKWNCTWEEVDGNSKDMELQSCSCCILELDDSLKRKSILEHGKCSEDAKKIIVEINNVCDNNNCQTNCELSTIDTDFPDEKMCILGNI